MKPIIIHKYGYLFQVRAAKTVQQENSVEQSEEAKKTGEHLESSKFTVLIVSINIT